jgi:uncharacterized RDD family membrane protein YckC
MNDNIYAPPSTHPEITDPNNEAVELASRGSRFGASILDSLAMMVITMPTMYFTGGFEGLTDGTHQQSLVYTVAMGILGLIVFCAINLKFLISSGQTIGKKALGIKIVDMDGNLPTLQGHLLKRYATFFIPAQIPTVGQIFSFVNVLFIFGKQKRCLHDFAGGTQVIKS